MLLPSRRAPRPTPYVEVASDPDPLPMRASPEFDFSAEAPVPTRPPAPPPAPGILARAERPPSMIQWSPPRTVTVGGPESGTSYELTPEPVPGAGMAQVERPPVEQARSVTLKMFDPQVEAPAYDEGRARMLDRLGLLGLGGTALAAFLTKSPAAAALFGGVTQGIGSQRKRMDEEYASALDTYQQSLAEARRINHQVANQQALTDFGEGIRVDERNADNTMEYLRQERANRWEVYNALADQARTSNDRTLQIALENAKSGLKEIDQQIDRYRAETGRQSANEQARTNRVRERNQRVANDLRRREVELAESQAGGFGSGSLSPEQVNFIRDLGGKYRDARDRVTEVRQGFADNPAVYDAVGGLASGQYTADDVEAAEDHFMEIQEVWGRVMNPITGDQWDQIRYGKQEDTGVPKSGEVPPSAPLPVSPSDLIEQGYRRAAPDALSAPADSGAVPSQDALSMADTLDRPAPVNVRPASIPFPQDSARAGVNISGPTAADLTRAVGPAAAPQPVPGAEAPPPAPGSAEWWDFQGYN